jgi:hypothetical protein
MLLSAFEGAAFGFALAFGLTRSVSGRTLGSD